MFAWDAIEIFALLASETRFAVVSTLAQSGDEGRMPLSKLATRVAVAKRTLRRQIAKLEAAGVVVTSREGNQLICQLDQDQMARFASFVRRRVAPTEVRNACSVRRSDTLAGRVRGARIGSKLGQSVESGQPQLADPRTIALSAAQFNATSAPAKLARTPAKLRRASDASLTPTSLATRLAALQAHDVSGQGNLTAGAMGTPRLELSQDRSDRHSLAARLALLADEDLPALLIPTDAPDPTAVTPRLTSRSAAARKQRQAVELVTLSDAVAIVPAIAGSPANPARQRSETASAQQASAGKTTAAQATAAQTTAPQATGGKACRPRDKSERRQPVRLSDALSNTMSGNSGALF